MIICFQEDLMKPIHPDYPSLVKEVRRQLASSQEDLARELVTTGTRQVEESHDEGETAMEIAA